MTGRSDPRLTGAHYLTVALLAALLAVMVGYCRFDSPPRDSGTRPEVALIGSGGDGQ